MKRGREGLRKMLGASTARGFVPVRTMPSTPWTGAVCQALSHTLRPPVSPLHPVNRTRKTGPNSPRVRGEDVRASTTTVY